MTASATREQPRPPLRPRWQQRAACRGTDPALFYADDHATIAAAKAVCAHCPVRAQCRDHAIAAGEELGVWGGLTPDERVPRPSSAPPGRPNRVSDDDLRALFDAADPDRPALEQLVAATTMSAATAYRTLDRALRLGIVERRGRVAYPATR
ncbi:MAG TPA: WhiB family transcriptional regulator [Ilumatobacter sp.]|nr:WhiB family transcriptional regulator [Ilumatobacter sp.]